MQNFDKIIPVVSEEMRYSKGQRWLPAAIFANEPKVSTKSDQWSWRRCDIEKKFTAVWMYRWMDAG